MKKSIQRLFSQVITLSLFLALSLLLSQSLKAQESVIFPTQLNMLYRGIDNPLKIVVENYDCESILVSSNTKLRQIGPCSYISVPGRQETADFRVYGLKNNDTTLLRVHQFRVLQTPDPGVKLGRYKSGPVPAGYVKGLYGLEAELYQFFIFDVKYEITAYIVEIERDQNVIFEKAFTGQIFPNDLKAQIRQLKNGDILRFREVVAIGPDKTPREIESASFQIR